MSMGDEVAGVTLQVVSKGMMTSMDISAKLLDMIAKLFQELAAMKRAKDASKGNITSNDLKELKSGGVSYRDLKQAAQKTGDSLVTTENGMSKEDMKLIAKSAKKYGISVAFLNPKNKESVYACVRNSDLPIFKKICAEVIKEKIVTQPEALGNFKCEKWQIPFLTAELKNLDVPAMFPRSEQGSFCLFEKKDERLVKLAWNAFTKKAEELQKEVSFDRDEEGYYTIKDMRTGKEVSFDPSSRFWSQTRLSRELQTEFGYDENKANMCAAKFGEEMLQAEERKHFFSNSIMNEFVEDPNPVKLEGENSLCQLYKCWYLRPKEEANAQIVFQDEESGKFAALDVSKLSRAQMREILSATLEISDEETLSALVDKAERVNSKFTRDHAVYYSSSRSFSEKDWKDSQLTVYTYSENGEETTKKMPPVKQVNQKIERNGGHSTFGRNTFTVECTFYSTVIDEKGNESLKESERSLTLSLTNKKKSIHDLTEMYKKQGIPASIAKELAKEVFHKAEMQSPEKLVAIEEVRAESMTIAYGAVSAEIPITSRETAVAEMTETLGIPTEQAETVVSRAEEIQQESVAAEIVPITAREEEIEPHLSENNKYSEIPTMLEEQPVAAASKPEPVFTPPKISTEEQMKMEQKRIAALSKVAEISPEEAEKALKQADMKAMMTGGRAELNVNLIGKEGLANVNAFVESLGESLGISREETIQTIKNANMAFKSIETEELSAATSITSGIGGNGHETHISETQTALSEAAKSMKPAIGIPEPPKPVIPHTRRK